MMRSCPRSEATSSRINQKGNPAVPNAPAVSGNPLEVENTLDEMVIHERDEFEKVANVYRWKKHYRFRTR